ncbi:SpoIVB peptidase [Anaeroselena agilis]|uniref:SpoIVB peptidase n=1 Tax=Anaeroselena agilis TaxID=3063788 RepID=A0ABU3NXV8_9FIRM|nr:SpoIVB peptidase [Selenomonadales bacterium 4137-cl]
MSGKNRRSAFGLLLAVLIVAFSFSPPFRDIYQLPPHMRIIEGETASLNVAFPWTMTVNQEQAVRVRSTHGFSRPVALEPVSLGKATLEFKLLGLIPVRTVQVDVLPPIKLVPGGHSIGVVLHSQGVIIVGHSPVAGPDGSRSPAKEAGIAIGDVILSINGTPVQSDSQLAEVIDASGRENRAVSLLVKRGAASFEISLRPVFCQDTRRYRIGLFVRDSAAGVGTLTFYEPQTNTYGALGHVITDSDTNQPIDCNQGKIVLATVSGIQHGRRGHPGEKIGVFIEEDQILGTIEKNTPFGIYGQLSAYPPQEKYGNGIPVASMSQVRLGAAELLTVIDGQKIEQFAIEIQKINLQETPEGKGLVIKVTDPRLLERTGGIVQGMSGSPILQNGKIIGAVTHVFVHDPTRGYGCFVDWMLMESGLIPRREKQTARKLFTLSGRFSFSGPSIISFFPISA